MQSCLKILFIDDHVGLRDGISYLLSQKNSDFHFYAACDKNEAVGILKKNPDIKIAIVDLNLDGENGLDAIDELRSLQPSLTVLIFTMFNDPLHIQQSLKKNIQGYITKNSDIDEIERAILTVSENNTYYNSQTYQVLHSIMSPSPDELNSPDVSVQLFKKYKNLTKKEQEVFALLAQKKEPDEIARMLGKSEKTVINQKSIIYQKLNIKDRLDIIEYAKILGILL